MNSILKLSFRQTENLLRLTKTIVHAYQLQYILVNDNTNDQCSFSYDLCNELRFIQKHLHSTCFLLQQALYRIQALRQVRADLPIRIDQNIFIKYEENLSYELKNIQEIILSIINENMLIDSPLNTLQILYKEIQENFEIFLDYIYANPIHKSTVFVGNLVSNTLERFYLILGTLARLVTEIK
ncbi:unnamed protein product [Adineta steineri]|uniref:Uncharacterized protein n=1 Tax=Adineta steineri TaxID=433720 RepID=A0A814K9Y5_9BILA|nr:unnamed protein product [Adineta steineri]CAF0939711.1 unnamed protein product [Adineta steineri]CAF1046538.1 unnamed protein product [Adineta steineri]